jgi:hypothetical protein
MISLLVLIMVAGGFFLYKLGVDTAPDGVDTTEYTLVVCFNGDQPTFGGLAEEVRVRTEGVYFTDAFGLAHFSNGVCVVTEGTQAQFAAQAEQGEKANAAGEAEPSVEQGD